VNTGVQSLGVQVLVFFFLLNSSAPANPGPGSGIVGDFTFFATQQHP
jgi:mannitol-specific phosphotransferase system IIBC component